MGQEKKTLYIREPTRPCMNEGYWDIIEQEPWRNTGDCYIEEITDPWMDSEYCYTREITSDIEKYRTVQNR